MSAKIDRLFSRIHKRYDIMNSVMSVGLDRIWRRDAAAEIASIGKNCKILDVACGTGEFSITITKAMDKIGHKAFIDGIDLNKKMLSIGTKKVSGRYANIKLGVGDATKMRKPSSNYDVVTTAFAMRDFDSLERFAAESYRVLRKGGKIVALDMAEPDTKFQRGFFAVYSKLMVFEGSLVDRNAYEFLVQSIHRFDKKRLVSILKKAGYKNVRIQNLATGVAFIATGKK